MKGFCFSKGSFGLFVDGAAFDVDSFLGEVAYAVVLGFGDSAAIGFENSGNALHEGAFASSVVSRKGDALFFVDGEGEVGEENSSSEFDA